MNLPTNAISDRKNHGDTIASLAAGEERWLLDRARLTLYRFLSMAASHPRSEKWSLLQAPDFQELAVAAAELIRGEPLARPEALARGELPLEALDLAPLISFNRLPRELLGTEYDGVFGLLISQDCPPYETEFCPQTFSVYRSHQLADVAGYYRAFGLEPAKKNPERQDHIVLELEFMAWLIAKTLYASENEQAENTRLCGEAQVSFFEDHLAWWVPAFALALRRKADGIGEERELTLPPKSHLGAVGSFLGAFVPAERAVLGISPPATAAMPSAMEEDSADCEGCSFSTDATSD
jgi:TorA maturation chaperone TorD